MKKTVLLSLFVLCLAFSAAAQEAETKTLTGQSDDGLVLLKSDDGKFNLALDGRINLAAALYSGNETPLGNGMEVRRARLGLKPTWGNWVAQFDIDFAGNEVDVKDMWIGYRGFKNMQITLGNHKGQFSVEEVTSSRYLTFMERGLPNAFAPDRRLGPEHRQVGPELARLRRDLRRRGRQRRRDRRERGPQLQPAPQLPARAHGQRLHPPGRLLRPLQALRQR
ncbi:MAG: OprO/OprP family phosphate-selective porin [Candidatus Moduliflexus flocculans]|nr:OprO/OprP family phosphate-selective porin [Candidatus Moduliflexus flocculans]